ncbi:hypothetical protein BH23BAC1_BH23BAC1_36240 [soil metagenome]
MKKLIIAFASLFFISGALHANSSTINEIHKDTIVIDFGNSSRILIYVTSQKDFDMLKLYDLNKMLRDLNVALDSTNKEIQVIKIEDQSGRYIKDSVMVLGPEDYQIDADTTVWGRDTADVVTINVGRIRVRIKDNNKTEIDLQKRNLSRRTRHSFNFDLGMNNYLSNGRFPDEDNALYTVRPFGSWFVGVNSIRKTNVSGPLFFEWGVGLNWHNFKFQDSRARFVKQDNRVLFYEEVAPLDPIRSKLTNSYINLSFVPLLDFSYNRRNYRNFSHDNYESKSFRIGLGGFAGYRLGGKSKFVYTEEGSSSKRKIKERDNFYLSNWRYGLRLQVGYRGLDLFANYDLNELFLPNRGPQLNAFSFGISL